MALLVMLLLALPVLAQPADCSAVPVGPPMDIDIYVDLTGKVKDPTAVPAPGRIAGGVGLKGIPAFGTLCQAPPPPAQDVLHGAAVPGGLLGGNGLTDLLTGRPKVVRPERLRPDAADQ